MDSAKELPDMTTEPESASTLVPGETAEEYHVVLFSMGLIPGVVISSEKIRRIEEAQARRAKEKQDKNKKPPKPPRRPNIPIGRAALNGI